MGKWLSVEEKENADKEYSENKLKIKELYNQISKLRYRQKKLYYYIKKRNRTGKGLDKQKNSVIYKMFGKGISELNKSELSKYNTLKKKESRERAKNA